MKKYIIIVILVFIAIEGIGQVELVPVDNGVYDFLQRMSVKQVITGYDNGNLPLSRKDIAALLNSIDMGKLKSADKELLSDLKIEYEFDINRSFKNTNFIFGTDNKKFDLDNNKYITGYIDSNASLFANLTGGIYYRNFKGDSSGNKKVLAGDLGLQIRGTLYDRVGYYFKYSSGKIFSGNAEEKYFLYTYDNYFRTSGNLRTGGKFFDNMEGYVRYSNTNDWISVTLGKFAFRQGNGYTQKLFLSGLFSIPMINLDLKYKSLRYSFSYGNIKDFLNAQEINNKMISTHRLDVMPVRWFRGGFFESVVSTSSSFSFEHLNPLSFITSGDLNSGAKSTMTNNTLIGFDVEFYPVKNISVQGSFLIDDINFGTIYKNDSTANDNKFGYQAGVMWNDAFMIPALTAKFEYTRLDPYTYSHRENNNKYAIYELPLGAQLNPNSDELAFVLDYYIYKRLKINFDLRIQRSGEGYKYDANGNIVKNYGGDINNGTGDWYNGKNTFLQGNRINRTFAGFNISFEPIRQIGINLKYLYKCEKHFWNAKPFSDNFFVVDFFGKW